MNSQKTNFFISESHPKSPIEQLGYLAACLFSIIIICVIAFFVLDEANARFATIAFSVIIVLLTRPLAYSKHVPKIQMVRLVNRRCFGHSIRLVNLVVLSGQRRALGRLLYGNANEPLSRVGWNYNNCTFNVTRLGLVAYYNGFNLYVFLHFRGRGYLVY